MNKELYDRPPGDHPLPHAELPNQDPLIFTVHEGEAIYRHHQSIHNPIFFGTTGNYRFDDPGCPAARWPICCSWTAIQWRISN